MFSNKERTGLMAIGTAVFTAVQAAQAGAEYSDFMERLTIRLSNVEKIADDVWAAKESAAAKQEREEVAYQEKCDCPACSSIPVEEVLAGLMGEGAEVKVVSIGTGEAMPPELAKLLRSIGVPEELLRGKGV